MAFAPGYFISPDGDVINVAEHFQEVARDPSRFGINPADKRLRDYRARDAVLIDVLKEGWIRVRQSAGRMGLRTSVETWRFDSREKDNLIFALHKFGLHKEDPVEIHELGTNKGYVTTAPELKAAGVQLNGPGVFEVNTRFKPGRLGDVPFGRR